MTNKYKTAVLNERKNTHGDYENTARISQRLKSIVHHELQWRDERGQECLMAEQIESLELICTKIARIIAGDADEPEHWNDIAGYAKLITEA